MSLLFPRFHRFSLLVAILGALSTASVSAAELEAKPDDAYFEKFEPMKAPAPANPLPGYGLYCRHVDGLVLSNVQLLYDEKFWREAPKKDKHDKTERAADPQRPSHALVCDDVANLTVDGLIAQTSPEGDPVIRFRNVRDALIKGCVAPKNTKVFLQAVGAQTSGVNLIGNVLTGAEKSLAVGNGTDAKAIKAEANIDLR